MLCTDFLEICSDIHPAPKAVTENHSQVHPGYAPGKTAEKNRKKKKKEFTRN